MAKFDAATAVDPIEYDFTKYGGGAGEVPEPTTGSVNLFFAEMRALLKDAKGITEAAEVDTEDADAVAEAMESMEDTMEQAKEFQDRMVGVIATLTQGTPSAEDLAKLPMRVMQAFTKFLVGEIRPKTDGTDAQVRTLPSPQDRKAGTRPTRKARR